VGPGKGGVSTYEIVEVFYAQNERVYRVIEKKADGQIQDVARLTSREKAQYYVDARTQQQAPEHNQW
tara:strand:- start:1257 stop:1457 length:201 start_codon:yes stop_codon:yes gene_type:complete